MPAITPSFPLHLLEAMRDLDRPEEVLEAENLSVSMPRRFGLNDVVYAQIRRLREEVRRRHPQTTTEVEDLIRLVTRRPDAARIFHEASRRQAGDALRARSRSGKWLLRLLPPPLAMFAVRRAIRRALIGLIGTGRLRVVGKPPTVQLRGSLTALADPGGTACTFYAGVLTEVLGEVTRQPWQVDHDVCEALGGPACEWRARPVT